MTKKYLNVCRDIDVIWLLFLWLPLVGLAAGDSVVELDHVKLNLSDKARILRGGENFKQSCLSCHSLNAFLNDDFAKELGLTKETMPIWPEDSWMGNPPPDLSLIALSMSPNWLYTYLRTFYQDAERPIGYNNLVFPNTNMPNPFVDLQGIQVLIDPNFSPAKHVGEHAYWYRLIKLKEGGSLSAEAFDDYIADIVQFLTYVSDPSVHEREQMAPWVLGYFLLFIGVTYAYFRMVGRFYFRPPRDH